MKTRFVIYVSVSSLNDVINIIYYSRIVTLNQKQVISRK